MRRTHRAVHRVLWPVLALAVAFGFGAALVLRPPPLPIQTDSDCQDPPAPLVLRLVPPTAVMKGSSAGYQATTQLLVQPAGE